MHAQEKESVHEIMQKTEKTQELAARGSLTPALTIFQRTHPLSETIRNP